MSGNKWEQARKAEEARKKAEAEAKRAAGVKTGASSDFAAKRASVQGGLAPRAPAQGQAAAPAAPKPHTGPTDAKFGAKAPSSPKSSVKVGDVAAQLAKKPTDVDAARARALESRRKYEEELAKQQGTAAPTRPASPPPAAKSPSPKATESSPRPGVGSVDMAKALAGLKKTSTDKGMPKPTTPATTAGKPTTPAPGKPTTGGKPKKW